MLISLARYAAKRLVVRLPVTRTRTEATLRPRSAPRRSVLPSTRTPCSLPFKVGLAGGLELAAGAMGRVTGPGIGGASCLATSFLN
jgi:hypothetical protein